MRRRLLPGLRGQLAIAIALVALLGAGATFLALYAGTTGRLRGQIDAQLRTQLAEWRQFISPADVSTPAALERAAVRFIAAQRYHAESLIIAVEVDRGATVSNEPRLLAREEARERRPHEPLGLLAAPPGLTDATAAEAGPVRVLTAVITSSGRAVGTVHFANPLAPVSQAQRGMLRTFLIVGLVSILVAIAIAIGVAALIAAPVRRVARVAEGVEAGDLTLRSGPAGSWGEARLLSVSFDHMLDRLESLVERQRQFVSDASHELRTPLAVLRAQIELLRGETDEDRRAEATATLLRHLDQLDRLMGDMLTLASADAGALLRRRRIDAGDFFEDLRRDLPLFGDRRFSVAPVGGSLEADPDRLTQVLYNLVRNAVAHSGPGDPIEVAARADGAWLEITVSDRGAGIPAEELERIFERFHRLDASRARESGGSGLGLAIARALVEAHGGTIHAEARPAGGATFRLRIPGYRALGQSDAERSAEDAAQLAR